MTWMGWQLPAMRCTTHRLSRLGTRRAGLTFRLQLRLVVGTSSTEWRSLPGSLRLALAGQAAPRRQGAAAEIPGTGKELS